MGAIKRIPPIKRLSIRKMFYDVAYYKQLNNNKNFY